jgi:hypothetical protein
MRHQAPNVWVSQRHSDTLSQDLRALVGKCFALSPILLSTGSAHSDMDDASYDASFRFLRASSILSISRKLVALVKVDSRA